MKLLNGIIFGIGLGLITIGITEINNGYSPVAIAIGSLLVLGEIGRLLFKAYRRT